MKHEINIHCKLRLCLVHIFSSKHRCFILPPSRFVVVVLEVGLLFNLYLDHVCVFIHRFGPKQYDPQNQSDASNLYCVKLVFKVIRNGILDVISKNKDSIPPLCGNLLPKIHYFVEKKEFFQENRFPRGIFQNPKINHVRTEKNQEAIVKKALATVNFLITEQTNRKRVQSQM